MTTLGEINRLKKEIEALKQRVAHSKGVIHQMMQRYRETMDEQTFHECLEALQQRRIEAEAAFSHKLRAYREKHHDHFGKWPPIFGSAEEPARQKVGS